MLTSKSTSKLLALATLTLGAYASHAAATVLIFEPVVPDGSDVDQTYGDRVTATSQGGFNYGADGGFTPNVVAAYGPVPTDIHHWNLSYGDLENVIYRETDGAGILEVTLTADPGYDVLLHGFDLAGWLFADYTINSVTVATGGGSNLFSQASAFIAGSGPSHSDFDFPMPLAANELVIRFDASNLGGGSDNIGIDNIKFGQRIIPEPASVALLTTALPLLFTKRRRRPTE